ncbi:rhodanese-like domain-containing protein [Thioalkalivibrio sp. ARh3]|uniref:rhodanese-like domain-containing protein n=1 Tax=Thioalkalivibrio sp. ARh3 TaxID=1158148 RepID=UPI000372533A|nr:rhodanese-like domain-containing protein [Thioalkalivibrio sp. ARh3]
MTVRFARPRVALVALCLSLAGAPIVVSAQQPFVEFPGRPLYERFGVEAVDLFDLRGQLSGSTVVDVRPRLEYDILHIEDAHHVDIDSEDFDRQIRALEEEHGSPLVFYCNGRQSYAGYRAAARADELGVASAQAYDAGMQDWVERYPGLARFRGEPANEVEGELISDEDFEARLLAADEFSRQARHGDDDVVVVDIRSGGERDEISLFGGREVGAPLSDISALDRIVEEARDNEQTLLIFDQYGQQVRWLQYHLEELGMDNYYFLEGGLQRFYDEVMAR